MKKTVTFLITAALTVGLILTGCAGQEEETAQRKRSNTGTEAGTGDILIAYFTWADNTVVEEEEAAIEAALSHYESVGDSASSEADAVSSASILPPGNAARIAEWIQEEVGGDLFSIRVEDPYPSDYDVCMERASEELAEDARPELAAHVEDMDAYSTVFLGFPNWWYTMPMAVHSFLEEYNFEDKTIIPFVTHGTGGLSRCIEDLEAALPESAAVLEPIGIYRAEVLSAQPEIQSWIEGLGIDFTQADTREGTQEVTQTEEEAAQMIRLTFTDGEIVVKLEENSAAEDLVSRLPLTMSFEDFNGTEKISYLESELDISGAPDSCTPQAGDLTYYAPWGNLAFFYNDFRESPQLVPLGTITEGREYLEQLDTAGEITIEVYEE